MNTGQRTGTAIGPPWIGHTHRPQKHQFLFDLTLSWWLWSARCLFPPRVSSRLSTVSRQSFLFGPAGARHVFQISLRADLRVHGTGTESAGTVCESFHLMKLMIRRESYTYEHTRMLKGNTRLIRILRNNPRSRDKAPLPAALTLLYSTPGPFKEALAT